MANSPVLSAQVPRGETIDVSTAEEEFAVPGEVDVVEHVKIANVRTFNE